MTYNEEIDLLRIPAYWLYMQSKLRKHIKISDRIMVSIVIVGILSCVYFSINPGQVADVSSFAACAGI